MGYRITNHFFDFFEKVFGTAKMRVTQGIIIRFFLCELYAFAVKLCRLLR